jgi:uncharacterized protein YkwD
MADGSVPISHQGFDHRSNKTNFYKTRFAENVAFNYNVGDPVEAAVNGWIKSPGHRANLLGPTNVCGIAVTCKQGRWYFTQLFAAAVARFN